MLILSKVSTLLETLVCINSCYVKSQRVSSQALPVEQDTSLGLFMKLLKREAS